MATDDMTDAERVADLKRAYSYGGATTTNKGKTILLKIPAAGLDWLLDLAEKAIAQDAAGGGLGTTSASQPFPEHVNDQVR